MRVPKGIACLPIAHDNNFGATTIVSVSFGVKVISARLGAACNNWNTAAIISVGVLVIVVGISVSATRKQ